MGSHVDPLDIGVGAYDGLGYAEDNANNIARKETRTSNEANKPLQFVTVTSAKQGDRKDVSKVVRTQAMRDYFWKQKHPNSSDQAASDLPTDPSQYKGRFRLNSPSNKPKAKTGPKREKIRGQKPNDVVRAQNGRIMMPRGPITDPGVYHPDEFFASAPADLLGRTLDPFNSFSLELKPETLKLVYYYKQSYAKDVLHLNVGGGYCLFDARENRALFHAILYLVALDYNLRRGSKNGLGCLYHSSEAFRLINEQIRNGCIEDATVAAVALIATKENLAGMIDTSFMHMQGLKYMVQKRGGIHNIKGIHRGVVVWADFLHSTVWSCPPQFPHSSISTRQDIGYLSEVGSPETDSPMESILGVDFPILAIVQSLRDVSAAKGLKGSIRQSKREASKRVYDIEYRLHLLKADVSDSSPISNEMVPLCVALNIYLYLAVRELPARARMIQRLADRLRTSLDSQSMLPWVYNPQKQSWILWMLFIGYGAAAESKKEEWFARNLKSLYCKFEFQDINELQDALKSVLWQESWCEHYFEKLKANLETSA
ncbi:hypothetical protein V8C37DRAFT_396122 [Trichoderma ceciliae]